MEAISAHEGDNMSGLLTIMVARKSDITAIPEPVEGVISTAVTFASGKSFVQWQAVPESGAASIAAQNSMEGHSKNTACSFVVPRDKASLKTMFDMALDDEFIIVVTDGNANQVIYGNLETPVRFGYSFGTGTGAGRNAYRCRFYSDSVDNRAFYLATVATPPATGQPVTIRLGSAGGPVLGTAAPGSTFVVNSPFKVTGFNIS
jgi:hypothetical protein